jgi:hypothetical protein
MQPSEGLEISWMPFWILINCVLNSGHAFVKRGPRIVPSKPEKGASYSQIGLTDSAHLITTASPSNIIKMFSRSLLTPKNRV